VLLELSSRRGGGDGAGGFVAGGEGEGGLAFGGDGDGSDDEPGGEGDGGLDPRGGEGEGGLVSGGEGDGGFRSGGDGDGGSISGVVKGGGGLGDGGGGLLVPKEYAMRSMCLRSPFRFWVPSIGIASLTWANLSAPFPVGPGQTPLGAVG